MAACKSKSTEAIKIAVRRLAGQPPDSNRA
jgi:hypothetical protein